MFKKATKRGIRLRVALVGPTGSGKTFTALRLASEIVRRTGGRIAVIDSERGSASKYADIFDFDSVALESFHPQRYIEALRDAERERYSIVIIDSLTHAWSGKDGILETVDKTKRGSKGSSDGFGAWRTVSPVHNDFVDTMLGASTHLIVTMRSKMTYQVEEYDDGGKKRTRVVKLGLQPVQRDDVEYEFDVVGDLDQENNLSISKTRCPALRGKFINLPGEELAVELVNWCAGDVSPHPDDSIMPPPASMISTPLGVVREDLLPAAMDPERLRLELSAFETLVGTDVFLAVIGGERPTKQGAARVALTKCYAAQEAAIRNRVPEDADEPFDAGPPQTASPPHKLEVVPAVDKTPRPANAGKQEQAKSEDKTTEGDAKTTPRKGAAKPKQISMGELWELIETAGVSERQALADVQDIFGVQNMADLDMGQRVTFAEMLSDGARKGAK